MRQITMAVIVGFLALALIGCSGNRPMEGPANARMTTKDNGTLTCWIAATTTPPHFPIGRHNHSGTAGDAVNAK